MTEEPGPDRNDDTFPEPGARPGVRPGGAKRRRTAGMRVSRPAPPPAGTPGNPHAGKPGTPGSPDAPGRYAGPREDAGPEPARTRDGWLDRPWVAGFRRFLDSTPGQVALLATAFAAALLGPLTIYSLFALAYVLRRPLRRAMAGLPLGPRTTVGVLIVLAGLLRHTLTWTSEYLRGAEDTILLDPRLGPGLLISLGLYTAWALGWGVALLWYRYRLAEALLIQGLFGIVIENFGQYLVFGLTTLPMGILLWLFAMAVSASTLGLAWVLAGDKLAALPRRESGGAFRYAAPPLLVASFVVAVFTLVGPLLETTL